MLFFQQNLSNMGTQQGAVLFSDKSFLWGTTHLTLARENERERLTHTYIHTHTHTQTHRAREERVERGERDPADRGEK